jgi:hypothetical protein
MQLFHLLLVLSVLQCLDLCCCLSQGIAELTAAAASGLLAACVAACASFAAMC